MPWFYLIFSAAVILCIVLLKMQRAPGRVSSRAEIAQVIADFLDGTGLPHDWDEFTSSPLKDPALDRIRRECDAVSATFPAQKTNAWCSEEGMAALRKIQARCLEPH